MHVNGNITLGEGGKINNLTLPHGTSFPANGNLGEKFFLSTGIDADTPKGEYEHDGTAWKHIPTLAEIKSLLATQAQSFRTVARACVSHNVTTATGTPLFTNHAVIKIASAFPADRPLPVIWIDPADYPADTKLRIHVHLSQNETQAGFGITLGLRKVTRPASGGGTAAVLYTLDATILGQVVIAGPQAVRAEKEGVSAEFNMPSTAGLYAFAYTTSSPGAAGACTQMTATLQAKY